MGMKRRENDKTKMRKVKRREGQIMKGRNRRENVRIRERKKTRNMKSSMNGRNSWPTK